MESHTGILLLSSNVEFDIKNCWEKIGKMSLNKEETKLTNHIMKIDREITFEELETYCHNQNFKHSGEYYYLRGPRHNNVFVWKTKYISLFNATSFLNDQYKIFFITCEHSRYNFKPDYPIAEFGKEYSRLHWLPMVIRRQPYELREQVLDSINH